MKLLSRWQPRDFIIAAIVAIIGSCLVGATINAVVTGGLDDKRAGMLRDIIISLVTIVSMYIGAKIVDK